MIDSIRLQRFRSYRDASFEFDGGVNIIIGPNASGKTNLLEAILVLCLGKSYRARDIEMIRFGDSWARLDGFFGKDARVVRIVHKTGKLAKSYELGGKTYQRLALERTIPVVLFEPNSLQLLIRGPKQRREYFDDILERSLPGFKKLAASYRRALAQRNALLKQSHNIAKKQLFAWNIRLSELGAQIASARKDLVDDINGSVPKSYSKIAKKRSRVELVYDSPIDIANYSSRLLSKLEKAVEADFRYGFTAYGPHRDDFVFYLNGREAAAAASRGETRSLIIALKIFELSLLERVRGQKPVFLLDDVFSELDGARRHHLVDHLKNHQTIITTTDADTVMEYFSTNHNLITLS